MMITDTVRRRILLTLFVITGPMLLIGMGLVILYRNSSGAASHLAAQISEQWGMEVRIDRIHHPLPGKTVWSSLTVFDRGEPIVQIPEIRIRQQRSIPDKWPKSFFSQLMDDQPDKAEAIYQALAFRTGTGISMEIPVLWVRESMQDRFRAFLTGLTTRKINRSPVYWQIGRIEWLDETAFSQPPEVSFDDKRSKNSVPEEAVEDNQSGEVFDGSDLAIVQRIEEFLQKSPNGAENLSGIWVGTPDRSLFIAAADPIQMAADFHTPVFFLFTQWNGLDADRTAQFDTFGVPFPSGFAARFLPALKTADTTSWVTGRIRWEGISKQPAIRLTHFSLAQTEFSPAAELITPQIMRGKVIRLTIENGEINDGVFLGTGEIRLAGAAIARSFIVRAQKALRLIFNPPTALNNQFSEDAVPFDQVRFGFELTREGVTLSSSYPTGVIGVFQSGTGEHSLFLPTEGEKTFAPYPEVLSALSDGESPYWSPFYRNAINSLPVD